MVVRHLPAYSASPRNRRPSHFICCGCVCSCVFSYLFIVLQLCWTGLKRARNSTRCPSSPVAAKNAKPTKQQQIMESKATPSNCSQHHKKEHQKERAARASHSNRLYLDLEWANFRRTMARPRWQRRRHMRRYLFSQIGFFVVSECVFGSLFGSRVVYFMRALRVVDTVVTCGCDSSCPGQQATLRTACIVRPSIENKNRTFAKRALRMHMEFGQRTVSNTLWHNDLSQESAEHVNSTK